MFWAPTSDLYYVSYGAVVEAMEKEPNFPPMLVMEWLPGKEFSVYCLCEKGECHYIVPNLREELSLMNTHKAIIEKNPGIEHIAQKICRLFKFDYNINIQLKYSQDHLPKLVEINPRLAGTITLPIAAGVDLVYWGILMALNLPFPKNMPIKYGTRIHRYWGEIYENEGNIFQFKPKKVDEI